MNGIRNMPFIIELNVESKTDLKLDNEVTKDVWAKQAIWCVTDLHFRVAVVGRICDELTFLPPNTMLS